MSIAAGIVPIHVLAYSYSRRAREIAAALNQSLLQADVLIRTSIYEAACAHWSEAAAVLERGVDIARRFSAWASLGEGLLVRALLGYGRGDFTLSRQYFEELVALGKRIGNSQYQTWGFNGLAFLQWQVGEVEAARDILEQALPLFAATSDFVAEIIAYEVLALVHSRLGNYPRARQANKTATRLLAEAPPNPLSAFFNYIFVATVYLDLWEINQDRPPLVQEAISRMALDACRSLRIYGWLFPVGQPRIRLTLGRSRWRSRQPNAAPKYGQKRHAINRRRGMKKQNGLGP
jgi:tetratricopeptide (TPR) repeat protein